MNKNILMTVKELHCKVCFEKFHGPHRLVEALVHLKYNHQKIFESKLKVADASGVDNSVDLSSSVVTSSSSTEVVSRTVSTQTEDFCFSHQKKMTSLSKPTDENRTVYPVPGKMNSYFVIIDAHAEFPYMCLKCWKRLLNLKMCAVHLLRTHSVSIKQQPPREDHTQSSASRSALESRRKSSRNDLHSIRTKCMRRRIIRERDRRRLSMIKVAILRKQVISGTHPDFSSPPADSSAPPTSTPPLRPRTPPETTPSPEETRSFSRSRDFGESSSVWNSLSWNSSKQIRKRNSLPSMISGHQSPSASAPQPTLPCSDDASRNDVMLGSEARAEFSGRLFPPETTPGCSRHNLASNRGSCSALAPSASRRTARKSTRPPPVSPRRPVCPTVEDYLNTSENIEFMRNTSHAPPAPSVKGETIDRGVVPSTTTPCRPRCPSLSHSSHTAPSRATARKSTGRKSISGRAHTFD